MDSEGDRDRAMTYLVGTKAQVAIFRAAIDAAEGMPRRGTVCLNGVPAPDADRLPKETKR